MYKQSIKHLADENAGPVGAKRVARVVDAAADAEAERAAALLEADSLARLLRPGRHKVLVQQRVALLIHRRRHISRVASCVQHMRGV